MNKPETVSAEFGDSLLTVEQFAARYPHLYPKPHRVRWLLRDRATNGLRDSGAVIEVYANGPHPALFIHVPTWFEWMRAGGSHAPRRNP